MVQNCRWTDSSKHPSLYSPRIQTPGFPAHRPHTDIPRSAGCCQSRAHRVLHSIEADGRNTVGVGATLTMSSPACGSVIGLSTRKKASPPLPSHSRRSRWRTLRPLPVRKGRSRARKSVVARSATNRNFPDGSITIVPGTTGTCSGLSSAGNRLQEEEPARMA